jgi:isopentenyl diphosphate isomerase/L-lactate dehydrogenase-like FMN-dependent dehydrogenase
MISNHGKFCVTGSLDIRRAPANSAFSLGGRQLDVCYAIPTFGDILTTVQGVPATLDSLRDCASVAKGKIPIAFDGGVRRGSDIFKALALGADFVFMGRVPIWGLAVSCDRRNRT